MSKKQSIDVVIPAFPYEGALYWFFSERGTQSYQGAHPYYLTLYGPGHELIVPRATALAALFDKIILAPADARLPDHATYGSSREYEHPDLRISMSWKYNEWEDENKIIADELLKSSRIQKLLTAVHMLASDNGMKKHFLCRTLLQMKIASEKNGILIGNTFFNKVYDEIMKLVGKKLAFGKVLEGSRRPWKLDPDTLSIVGLDFRAKNLESFAAIRHSHEISEYAKEFRSAISTSLSAPDLTQKLLELMKKAMDQERVMTHVAGGFKTVGSVANVAGLVPFVGTIGAAVGISADISQRALENAKSKKQWYLLGSKMSEIALKDALSRVSTC